LVWPTEYLPRSQTTSLACFVFATISSLTFPSFALYRYRSSPFRILDQFLFISSSTPAYLSNTWKLLKVDAKIAKLNQNFAFASY